MEAAGKIEDEEYIDHHIQNSESTSTDINFHPSKDEEDNNSYTQESKRKQSKIISQQKQANISRITIDNNKSKNMLGFRKSKRESICKNDYSLRNNTNDKLEYIYIYIYQLPNSSTSLKTKTEFTTNNISITTTAKKHKLKQSKFVSKTEKDPSVRNLVENNTNNNMIVQS